MFSQLLAQGPITNPALNPDVGAGEGGVVLALLMARLFRTLMIVGGLALLLFLAWGGIAWITAGGDKGKLDEARSRITNAVIGMAILVAVIAIAMLLSETFGFDLLNPTLPTGEE